MKPETVLATFFERALVRKAERFVGFAHNEKNRKKVLNALHHELSELINPQAVVAALPLTAWEHPALGYHPPNTFGKVYATLTAAHSEPRASILVLTSNGRYGFYREEGRIDSEVLFDLARLSRR